VSSRKQGVPDAVQQAKASLMRVLAGEPAVIGIGVSADADGRPALIVLLADDAPRPQIPAAIQGIPVSISRASRPRKL
jgi:hypothetical protein